MARPGPLDLLRPGSSPDVRSDTTAKRASGTRISAEPTLLRRVLDGVPKNGFVGSSTYVLNKAEVDAGGGFHGTTFGPDPYWRPAPARSTSTTTTQYVVAYDSPTSSNLETMAITGVPSASTLASRTITALPIAQTTTPPDALQPGQSSIIATDEPAPLEAVWQDNVLWTGGNDGCTPSGDTSERSCLRLDEVAAPSSGTPSLTQDFDVVAVGGYLYYPGVALDSSNNLHVPYTFSNTTSFYPSGQVLALAGGSPTTWSVETLFGGSVYQGLDSANPPVRWGDYSGAAIDPQPERCLGGDRVWGREPAPRHGYRLGYPAQPGHGFTLRPAALVLPADASSHPRYPGLAHHAACRDDSQCPCHRSGVPAGATAAVLNVTATNPTA